MVLMQHDWSSSISGNSKEGRHSDMPRTLGKVMIMTTYQDTNLYFDMVAGRSYPGVIHLSNQ